MKMFKMHWRTLEQSLRTAYHDKTQLEVRSGWQFDMMRSVRQIGPLNEQASLFVFANRFVWRFATAVCAVALLLSVYMISADLNPITSVTDLFLGNPVEFTVVQAFEGY